MAKRGTVPKFGTWDKDNVGYTVYFEKVRENKGASAPPLHNRPYNIDDPEEGPLRAVPPPSTAGRRPNGQTHGHRRVGSSSSSESKFAPPPQYHPRPSPEALQHQHHGDGHRHRPSPIEHGGGGHNGPQQAPRQHRHHHHHHRATRAPRARSASPQSNAPNRQRPSAVPRFGVWDEQNAAAAAQGFTVQFERVKRDREAARAGGVPVVPCPPPPPPEPRRSHRDSPFFSKMFGCFRPTDRY